MTEASLTPARMEELRQEYKLSSSTPATIHMKDLSFKEVLERTDATIIAEVIRPIAEFSVELPSGPGTAEGAFADKQISLGGLSYQPKFTAFQVKVKEVITGVEVTDTIHLVFNSEFKEMEPALKPGMKIVTAIKKADGQREGNYFFTRYGTFYIVDEDYVLAAFEGQTEEILDFNRETNGKSLQHLLGLIQTMKRD